MSKEIINLVKDRTVAFLYAFDKHLWYKTDKGFIFPVPIDDCGDASFLKKDKASLFMRYIRKQFKEPINEPKIRNTGIQGKGISFEYFRKGYCYYNLGEDILFPISIKDNSYLRDIEDTYKFFKDIKDYKESISKD